uniref:Uncharacterized protein n=1 Tax=Candidatus Kentrum sp. LPFa TaxID=2126335 RepID=A0A450XLC4_9GAMM|nr:MAG: hypothetical protein BECKLPF1236C_GA0070990_100998 [Candidatus Kentron sp. LPFa]
MRDIARVFPPGFPGAQKVDDGPHGDSFPQDCGFPITDVRVDGDSSLYSVTEKIFDKTIKKYQGNISYWIPAYQGNDGRVVDENLPDNGLRAGADGVGLSYERWGSLRSPQRCLVSFNFQLAPENMFHCLKNHH